MRLVLLAGIPDVEVREAASLEQAVRGYTEPPTLVLLDIQLQGVNGIEGLVLLKQRWPQAIPLCQTRCYGCLPFLKGKKTGTLKLSSR